MNKIAAQVALAVPRPALTTYVLETRPDETYTSLERAGDAYLRSDSSEPASIVQQRHPRLTSPMITQARECHAQGLRLQKLAQGLMAQSVALVAGSGGVMGALTWGILEQISVDNDPLKGLVAVMTGGVMALTTGVTAFLRPDEDHPLRPHQNEAGEVRFPQLLEANQRGYFKQLQARQILKPPSVALARYPIQRAGQGYELGEREQL